MAKHATPQQIDQGMRQYLAREARAKLPRLQGRPHWPRHGRNRARREAARRRAEHRG